MINALSVDVEDYFHPSEVQLSGAAPDWASLPSRVEPATARVLALLERHRVKATFFVLGWVAEHHPRLLRRIAAAGHEIGCHSYAHQLVYRLSPRRFREDTLRARKVIEDVTGQPPVLYRAPSYSITPRSRWALEILAECGFRYDSSIYPVRHDRYGMPGFDARCQRLETPAGPLIEVPVAAVRLSRSLVTPVGGGAYLRLLPYRYLAAGIRRINRRERRPACIYFHPWEIDPDQPRLLRSPISRLRTYTGLRRMEAKLDRLLGEFSFSTISRTHPAAAGPPPREPAARPDAGGTGARR